MANQGRKNLYRPSKELLKELLLYASTRELAPIIGVNQTTISNWCKPYGLDGKQLRYRREFLGKRKIPQELIDKLRTEQKTYSGITREPMTDLPPDECEEVPIEVFNEPEPIKETPIPTRLNTCDIPAMIQSGNLLNWFYAPRKTQEPSYYGGYIGVPNRRNSEGNGKAVRGVKLA
jgi:hypothetical protein